MEQKALVAYAHLILNSRSKKSFDSIIVMGFVELQVYQP